MASLYRMKRLLFTCLLIFICFGSFAQILPAFSQVMLKKQKDYKAAEPVVVQTADYVLATPIDQNTEPKKAAAQFLMKWMDGTADYTFTLDENSTKSFLQNAALVEVYLAAMSKFAIENKPKLSKTITLFAIKNLLAYINNPANNVTKTDGLKALSEANDKNQLESFLNL
jgi:hypothetical protein